MHLAIELRQESGLSERAFWKKEEINYQVSGYWLKKLRNEQAPKAFTAKGFVGLNVEARPVVETISIRYPNGVILTCSEQLSPQKLKALIGLF